MADLFPKIFSVMMILLGICMLLNPNLYAQYMKGINVSRGIKTTDKKGLLAGSKYSAIALIIFGILIFTIF